MRVGVANCETCGAQVTNELVEGEEEPITLDTVQTIATRDNHMHLYRMSASSAGGRSRFEKVTRPGQVGQMVHSQTCRAAPGGQHG